MRHNGKPKMISKRQQSVSQAFEAKVARKLHSLRYVTVTRQARLPGLMADFLVHTPKRKIVLEAKTGRTTPAERQRLGQAIKAYRNLLRNQSVYAVVDGLSRSRPRSGLLSSQDLSGWIRQVGFYAAPRTKKAAKKGTTVRRKIKAKRAKAESVPPPMSRSVVFVAMPFDGRYDDTFLVAMSRAAKRAGAACDRIDKAEFAGDIVSEIKRRIRRAAAVIADLSGAKPNVLYEVGFAHALRRPTIHISSTSLSRLPFDVKTWNTLPYQLGRTHDLTKELTKRLRQILPTRHRR